MEYTPPASRFATPQHNQLSRLGEFQFSFQPLPPVPEDAEHQGEDTCSVGANFIGGIASVSNSGEPTPKKQCIESFKCAGCNEIIAAKNALLRHQRGCDKYCAKTNTSLSSYKCQVCGLTVKRLDTLRRHVQRKHEDQGSGRPQDSGSIVQQGSFDTALESQGSEFQPRAVTYPLNVASNAFTGSDSTNCYNNAFQYSDTNDIIASELATGEYQIETYPQAFTTPAAEPDLQTSGYVGFWPEVDWTPDQSGISYQGTSISASSNELTPATSKLSPASFVHEVATTADHEINADAELAALADRSLNLNVPYLSAKPVSQGRNLRPRRIRNPIPCPLCGEELGIGPEDGEKVQQHLQRHLERIQAIDKDTVSGSEPTCIHCKIDFLDPRDLARHSESARTTRSCGFQFDHLEGKCTGHHPQEIDQTNPDHHRFKNALRQWERLQRCAYLEYFAAYSRGLAPTNAPSYVLGLPPAWRRSTGSIRSMMSLESAMSTSSLPVRFRYLCRTNLKSSLTTFRRPPPILLQTLAEAFANDNLDLVVQICVKSNMLSLYPVSDRDLSAEMYWYCAGLSTDRVRCFVLMVEQGLQVSKYSVWHLTAASADKPGRKLLFVADAPIPAQSRLAQYIFLCAIARGLDEVVMKLLYFGVLSTSSEVPDANFIKGLDESNAWFSDRITSDATTAEFGMGLGPLGLILALNTRNYYAASLLITYGVAPLWGIRHLTASKSAMQNLECELQLLRWFLKLPRGEAWAGHHLQYLAKHLLLLETTLLKAPAGEISHVFLQ
jgi:hypothetical protein